MSCGGQLAPSLRACCSQLQTTSRLRGRQNLRPCSALPASSAHDAHVGRLYELQHRPVPCTPGKGSGAIVSVEREQFATCAAADASASALHGHIGVVAPRSQQREGRGRSGGDGGDERAGSARGAGAGGREGSSSNSSRNSLRFTLSGLWEWYKQMLARYPLETISVQAAVIGLVGDVIAQRIEGADDRRRSAKMFAWGLLVSGPIGHFFYGWLDGRFPTALGWTNVAKKVVVNSLCLSPIMNFLFLCYSRSVELALDGRADRIPPEVRRKLEEEWLGAYLKSFTYWPAVHAVNFALAPPQYRMLVLSLASVVWTAYLSFIGHRKAHPDTSPEF